jgi:secretion/DNA translocation related CpaE-like protein
VSRNPLIVTTDPVLLDDLRRLVAAAGGEPVVALDLATARDCWAEASLVLLGDDVAAGLEGGLPSVVVRRGGVVLVGRDLDDGDVWRRAVTVGAEHVVFLPDAEPWLVDRVRDAQEDLARRGHVVGVMGGRGGAGATTLAVALSLAGGRAGRDVVLVDADALGGGIDLTLGAEGDDGPRWLDVVGSRGELTLPLELPRFREVALLACTRAQSPSLPPDVVREVLHTARREHGLVVVDLPRSFDPGTRAALSQLDTLLLVVPAEVRACAAAAQVAVHACDLVADVRVVVRGPAPSGLDAEVVAEALGLPLAGWLRREPGLATALERGQPPGGGRRGPLATFAASFVGSLPVRAAGGGAAA